AESLATLDRKLAAVLAGTTRPADAGEAIQLAWLCGRYKRLYAAGARLSAEAVDADPSWAEAGAARRRSNAAVFAAPAGRGGAGGGAGPTPAACGGGGRRGAGPQPPAAPAGRAALRTRAAAWLRADLAVRRRQAQSAADRAAAADALAHWLGDPDLGGLRPG